MECLTPPVAYVPVEEWFCPACSSQTEPHEDREGLAEEGHGESLGLREVPRARTTRGRPRGSIARRVSVLGRTGLVYCCFVYQKIIELIVITNKPCFRRYTCMYTVHGIFQCVLSPCGFLKVLLFYKDWLKLKTFKMEKKIPNFFLENTEKINTLRHESTAQYM